MHMYKLIKYLVHQAEIFFGGVGVLLFIMTVVCHANMILTKTQSSIYNYNTSDHWTAEYFSFRNFMHGCSSEFSFGGGGNFPSLWI